MKKIVLMKPMINLKFTLSLAAVAMLLISSCAKPEGEGGTSTIQGKVWAQDYNGSGVLQEEFYAPDENVYIIYGDEDNYYDDRYETSFDGSYRFQYLRPGTYTVFVYSDCVDCYSGIEAVSQTVEVTGNNEDIILDDLVIRK